MQYVDALAAFLVSRQAAGRSANTVDWYRYMLDVFGRWLREEGLDDVRKIEPEHIELFLSQQRAAGHKPRTVQGRYRAVSALFGWLAKRNKVASSPVANVERPATPRHEPRRADLADLAALLESIPRGDWVDLRDRLVIRMLFWSGLRRAELSALNVADVDLAEEQIHVRKGKGDKGRVVPLHPSLRVQVLEYLFHRPTLPGETALFLGLHGNGTPRGRLLGGGMRQMLQRRATRANVPYWNPHAYRHAVAMKLLNDGEVELGIVSKILGHSSPEITRRIYADFTDSSVKRAYAAALARLPDAL